MVVGLEIVSLVAISVKEGCLTEMQQNPVICPAPRFYLYLLAISLWQEKEDIAPISCLILPPSRQFCHFFLENSRAEQDKRDWKVIGLTEISRQNRPNLFLVLLTVKKEIAAVDVGDRVLKAQLRQIGLQIRHDNLVSFPPTLMPRSKRT